MATIDYICVKGTCNLFCLGLLVGSAWATSRNLYTYRCDGQVLSVLPSLDVKQTVRKMVIGGLIILPIYIVARKLSVFFFAKLSRVSLKRKDEAKRDPHVELPYKYLSCFITGSLSTSLVPWVLEKLGMW